MIGGSCITNLSAFLQTQTGDFDNFERKWKEVIVEVKEERIK